MVELGLAAATGRAAAAPRPAAFRTAAVAVGVGLAYFAACRLGFLLTPEPGQLALVWPASGVAFVACWLLGWPAVAAVFVGDLASTLVSQVGPMAALIFAAGNTVAAVMGVTLVRRLQGGSNPLGSANGALAFVLGGALAPSAVAAAVGTMGMLGSGLSTGHRVATVLQAWLLSDTAGVLLVGAFGLAFIAGRPARITATCFAATLGAVGATIASSWLVFVHDLSSPELRSALAFLLVPVFVAAALTLGRRRLMTVVATTAAIAIVGTLGGHGPFAGFSGHNPLLLLQLFLVTLLITALLIQGLVHELRGARLNLQQQVDERTAALRETNRQLRVEMDERSAAEASRRALEARLARAEKMEAVGTLAGGVAHDLNNILTGLVGYPELILMKLPASSPLQRPVEIMERSAQRAAAIVQDLLTLARRGLVETEVVDLNAVIREHFESPEHARLAQFHPDVRLAVALDPELLRVQGSPAQLAKVVMNLVSNATEAISGAGAGSVRVSTRNRYVDRPVAGYDDVAEGEYVVLEVADDGAGIAEEDLARVFEPFYTKKKLGRSGTGLGMAVVWGTVKDHHGYIDVTSRVAVGTTVSVYLPATRDTAAPEVVSDDLLSLGGSERILVVDDVELQRDMARDILAPLGYRVDVVASGEAGCEAVAARAYDLVLLDMIMAPGIDGLETYRRMLGIRPGLRAVVASGYSETDRVQETLRLGAGRYLRKPYRVAALAAAVRAELDRR